jgi:hypothetical protein
MPPRPSGRPGGRARRISLGEAVALATTVGRPWMQNRTQSTEGEPASIVASVPALSVTPGQDCTTAELGLDDVR